MRLRPSSRRATISTREAPAAPGQVTSAPPRCDVVALGTIHGLEIRCEQQAGHRGRHWIEQDGRRYEWGRPAGSGRPKGTPKTGGRARDWPPAWEALAVAAGGVQQLADRLSVRRRALERYVSGDRSPSRDVAARIEALARELGVANKKKSPHHPAGDDGGLGGRAGGGARLRL